MARSPDNSQLSPSTRLLRSGHDRNSASGAIVPPIYQTTAFAFDSCEEAAELFSLNRRGHMYGRTSNPTNDTLERRVCDMEGGTDAVSAASGKAALMLAVLSLAASGDNIVSSRNLYGGTYAVFTATLRQLGIKVRLAEADTAEAFLEVADERTRMFYGETLSNPMLRPFPITEIAEAGEKIGIPLVVDNTLTPTLVAPLEQGARATVLSCSKYVAGQGAVLGGCLTVRETDWAGRSERFPLLCSPDPAYGGVTWCEIGDRLGVDPMALRARFVVLRDLGGVLSPHSAFLILQGIGTLTLRMARHCDSALKVARWLSTQPGIARVTYPGLDRRMARALAKGSGGMIGVELAGGLAAGRRFIEALSLFDHVANNGDARSLAIHPGSTMLAQLSSEQRRETGVSEGYVRLCIGLEDPADLIADLAHALTEAGNASAGDLR